MDDPDRKRRKQAEFLIYKSLPFEALIAIATYSNGTKQSVENYLTAAVRNVMMGAPMIVPGVDGEKPTHYKRRMHAAGSR